MNLPTIHFEIGDLEYSIKVESYSPPTNPTRDDPGDTGECELARFATVSVNGVEVGCVPYSVLLLDLASDTLKGVRAIMSDFDRFIYDRAMDACAEYSEDWYERVRTW